MKINSKPYIGICGGSGSGKTSDVNQITKYFDGNLDYMYFSHGIIDSRKNMQGSIITIFSIKK